MARPRPETGGTFTSPTKTILNQLGEEVEVFTTGPQAGKDAEGNVVIQQADQTSQPFVTSDTKLVNPIDPVNSVKDLADRRDSQSAYDILYNQFNQYGLGTLVEDIRYLIQSNVSPSQFSLELQNTKAYQNRFAANKDRIAKGLRSLSPAEYIGLEDQYQNVMRNYGLPASYYTKDSTGKQAGFEKFLSGDVSASELEDRIGVAQKRVINANPEVTTALKQFYPDITNADILAYTLDPAQGLESIKRKVTAAEIGGAAIQSGLAANLARAEELGRYGVDKASATEGYSTIGAGLQRGSQLSDIYSQSPYTQATAESEVFKLSGAQEARKQRQKVTGLEKATFGGQTGITQGALNRDRAGGY